MIAARNTDTEQISEDELCIAKDCTSNTTYSTSQSFIGEAKGRAIMKKKSDVRSPLAQMRFIRRKNLVKNRAVYADRYKSVQSYP